MGRDSQVRMLINDVNDTRDQNRNIYYGFFSFFVFKGIRIKCLQNACFLTFGLFKSRGELKLFLGFKTGAVDTGTKFIIGVVDTSTKFSATIHGVDDLVLFTCRG